MRTTKWLLAMSAAAISSMALAGGGTASAVAGLPDGSSASVTRATTAAGPAGPGGTWGDAMPVPGLAALNTSGEATVSAVSCASPGNCGAVGSYEDSAGAFQPFVANEIRGIWGTAREVPGIAAVGTADHPEFGAQSDSVSCKSPGYCSAGGYYFDRAGATFAYVVNEAGGTWGDARAVRGVVVGSQVAGAVVNSVSCGFAGNCSAIGNYTVGANGASDVEYPFVVNEVNSTWGDADTVTGLGSLSAEGGAVLDSVSCASAGNCGASGYRFDALSDYGAFVVNETGGTWGDAQDVQGLSNSAGEGTLAISCPTAGNCSAAGFDEGEPGSQTFIVDETAGTWGTAKPVPAVPGNTGMLPTALSCASPAHCTVNGPFQRGTGGYSSFVADEVNGTVGTAAEMPGLSSLNAGLTSPSLRAAPLSCAPTGYCAVGGQYAGTGSIGLQAFVASKTDGTWRAAKEVAGLPTLAHGASDARVTAISCTATGYCAAGGSFEDTSHRTQAFVMNEANASGLVLGLSEPLQLTYGHEQLEQVFVGVGSTAGVTPTGTVTVTLGGRRACTITLTAGAGSCRLAPASVPVGNYRLTITYSGDATYINTAVSWLFPIAVTKATTTTALSLSKASVTYGHESAERLSVAVAPRYAGTASGKVIIKTGKTTICLITLKAGKGSCTLTSRQLKAGTYTLVASYGGSADYHKSTARGKNLKVAN